MKNSIFYITTFMLMAFQHNINAQTLAPEFEFQLYFEDAAGNRDTVTLGYDANATDGIDSEFGEINIVDEDWSSDEFQVRITNKMYSILELYPPEEPFRVKKRIIKNKCPSFWMESNYIDFKNPVFPVTVSYDYDLLNQNGCIKWSVIGTQHPTMLWDLEAYQSNMSGHGSSIFTFYNLWDDLEEWPEHFKYQDIDGKTIYTIWINFHSSYVNSGQGVGVSTQQIQNLTAYPNPFNESFELEEMTGVDSIKIYDLLGKEIQFELLENKITPLTNENGIYFLTFLKKGQWHNLKMIKI